MTFNARKVAGGGSRPDPLEPGSYPARLVQVISLGLQSQSYLGETKEPRHQLMLTYELLDEFLKDEEGNDLEDKPRWMSEDFPLHNLEADRAKSTARYFALDPSEEYEGDFSKLVGTPCVVTIIVNEGKGKNKGKFYNNVSSVSSMRAKEASKAPELVNDTVVFDPDDPDMDAYEKFPDYIKDKIKAGLEYEGSKLNSLVDDTKDDSDDKDERW